MAFSPQSQAWPGRRAFLMVHGIGDASAGMEGSFPADALRDALGPDAATTAVYRLNYDFINDWLAVKTNLEGGVATLKQLIAAQFGDSSMDAVIAEYAGDVLWPILSPDLRFAVRDAFASQLQQILLDRNNAADARGDDPLEYGITILAHSLGCYHTYEMLTAAANDPSLELQPASDLVKFESVILMASPVQLIRTVAGGIAHLIPDIESIAALSQPLAIPFETRRGRSVRCTKRFVSVAGTHDPIGGHLLGKRLNWAYMKVPGQKSVIVEQSGLNLTNPVQTAQALAAAFASGEPAMNDPHSWTAYIASQGELLQTGVVA
jgi:hypothetical protein